MTVVQDKNVIRYIPVRRVTVDAGYVMTVIQRVPVISFKLLGNMFKTKGVPIMDIPNGLKKRIIPEL